MVVNEIYSGRSYSCCVPADCRGSYGQQRQLLQPATLRIQCAHPPCVIHVSDFWKRLRRPAGADDHVSYQV